MDQDQPQPESISQLIEALQANKLSRRAFVAGAIALGVTAAGASVIASEALRRAPAASSTTKPKTEQHDPIQKHVQHISTQLQGDVNSHMADYADHAVVEDPLFAAAFVGKEAIAQRFAAEITSVPDRTITVLNRIVTGSQLIIEWEARGAHVAPYFGIGGNGQTYVLRGVTITTRENGKIVREAHFYSPDELRRQIQND